MKFYRQDTAVGLMVHGIYSKENRMGRRWHNVELSSKVQINGHSDSDAFRKFLMDNNIKYETSAAGDMIHFEVLIDNSEMEKCDTFLGTFIN